MRALGAQPAAMLPSSMMGAACMGWLRAVLLTSR
eukprot:COSAG05_NODE_11574_length_506_cov_2.147420_1_plen_33_part_10